MSGNSKGNGESYGYNTQTESRKTRNVAGKNPSYGRTIVSFLGPSRQRPLSDVIAVQLAVYRRPWTYCLVKLVLKGQHSFLLAVYGSRRQQTVSSLVDTLTDFLGVPRAVQDQAVAGV